MANGIYVASSGSKARLAQLETVSNNLANLMTAGFKKQEAVYREIHNDVSGIGSPEQALGVRTPNRILPEDRINVAIDDRFTYWSQGNLDETGNVLDVAIEGQGFFKVQDNEGNQFLTRHGRFQLSAKGVITNQSGLELLDKRGKSIRLPASQGLLSISHDGQVAVGNTRVGQIALVNIEDGSNQILNKSLTQIGEALFRIDDPNVAQTKGTGIIRQGYMEGSNVNAVLEMTHLLSTSRLFEFDQQAIKARLFPPSLPTS